MKVIYIAGPYRDHLLKRVVNIWCARQAALFVWLAGAVALCPHLNTAFFDGRAPDDWWLRGDLELMWRCDAVWFVGDWVNSYGATFEHTRAGELGLPRLYSEQDVLAFLRGEIPCSTR